MCYRQETRNVFFFFLQSLDMQNKYLNKHKSVFLFTLGCENAAFVLTDCQNGHLVIFRIKQLSLDGILDVPPSPAFLTVPVHGSLKAASPPEKWAISVDLKVECSKDGWRVLRDLPHRSFKRRIHSKLKFYLFTIHPAVDGGSGEIILFHITDIEDKNSTLWKPVVAEESFFIKLSLDKNVISV